MRQTGQRTIEVWADWAQLGKPACVGVLNATPARGKEVFSFAYDAAWLKNGHWLTLDPALQLYTGPQFQEQDKPNFGLFLDSSPDRWGRKLMDRREAQAIRQEGRPARVLLESDYLLGVYDAHRMGGLRFRTDPGGPFLDDIEQYASPPWTSLRELEHACTQIERQDAQNDPSYSDWLRILIAPGGSLGGARPKAGVVDEHGNLWIAKFPSSKDDYDVGAWEYLVCLLGWQAGIECANATTRKFASRNSTFLTKRFDRTDNGQRLHFASAMTLLGRTDGDDASTGASYLEMAELIVRQGASPNRDLQQLWRRIVFSVCVTNTDDHLRNHGFLLDDSGWRLSPAYDINPVPVGYGLTLNINETDNALDLDLAMEVHGHFRLSKRDAEEAVDQIVAAVKNWRSVASTIQIVRSEQDRMQGAFAVAEARQL
jgi:serine/threonine-protein kinase HipA